MPITYEELLKELKDKKKNSLQKCAICNIPLQETITGNRKTKKGQVCSDCYFEKLGNLIEKNPIVMPKAVRRT